MPQKLFKLILLYTDRTVTKHTQLQAEMRKVPSMLYLTIQCTKAIFILDEPVLCARGSNERLGHWPSPYP